MRKASRPYITVTTVAPQGYAASVQAPVRLEFRTKAMSVVGAVVAGRLGTLAVQVGEKVKAGATLATLSSVQAAQMRADFVRAKAELQRAENLVQRQRAMQQAGVGVELQMMEATARAQEARADYERTAEDVQLLGEGKGEVVVLRAPIDGTVLRIDATAGAALEPGATLFELGEPGILWAVADVFEQDVPLIEPGAEATIDFPTVAESLRGSVVTVSAAIEPELRRGAVFIEFDAAGHNLEPGMFGRATIRSTATGQIVLPTTAVLIKDGRQTIVYLEVADNRFEPRNVRVGQARSGMVPVLEGLTGGERVVTAGALLLDAEAAMLL